MYFHINSILFIWASKWNKLSSLNIEIKNPLPTPVHNFLSESQLELLPQKSNLTSIRQ